MSRARPRPPASTGATGGVPREPPLTSGRSRSGAHQPARRRGPARPRGEGPAAGGWSWHESRKTHRQSDRPFG
ncbi:hypothetical protein ACFPRL_17340 [Pseudoclavibacter helvolus]